MSPELRQKLLELHYGLLPEDEATELRRRIAGEPEVASAYAESEKSAALFSQAARLSLPKPAFKRPEDRSEDRREEKDMSTASEMPVPQKLSKPFAVRRSFGRGANWFVGLAALILVLVSSGGYFYYRHEMSAIAAQHLRLIVSGPSTLQTGVESQFSVRTTEVTGEPLPAQVEVGLYSPEGKRLFNNKESTDKKGQLQVTIPSDMTLPVGTTIKFVAWNPSNNEEKDFIAPLAIEPVRFGTLLSLDKPLYQPGETIYFRSLTLSRFNLAVDHEIPLSFEIFDPSGAAVANSKVQGLTDHGVGNGSFQIPEDFPGGEYSLVAKSIDQSFPEEKRKFFIRHYRLPRLKKEIEFVRDSYTPGDTVVADFSVHRAEGGPSAGANLQILATVDEQVVFQKNVEANEFGAYRIDFPLPEKIERGDGQLSVIIDDGGTKETMAKTIPINLGKVEVKFYPEGGDLVADLENRVYFSAKNPLGKPVHIRGQVLDSRNQTVTEIETAYEGMGVFTFLPRSGGKYRLKINSPTGVKEEKRLPLPMSDRFLVLNTGTGVFGANEPLEFNIRSSKPNLPLVVGAWCRGVLVGQQPLVTQKNEGGANPVSINLPEGIGGVIRLTVFDYSPQADVSEPQPPKPIAERLVYRRLAKKLSIRTEGTQEKYSPGEKVKMSLAVTNEKGEPTPAALGVAVVDDALLNLADDKSPGMTTHFLLTTEIEKPEDLEKADFYLSEESAGGKGNLPSLNVKGVGDLNEVGKKTENAQQNINALSSLSSNSPNSPPKGEGIASAKIKASAALDLLLGTQGWRRFAEKTLPELKQEGQEKEQLTRLVALSGTAGPPTLYDNLGQIRKDYEKSLATYNAERTRVINIAMVICFVVGLGLLLLVLMLGILKLVRGFSFWLPVLGSAACCILIASMTLDPSQFNLDKFQAVAFSSYRAKMPEKTVAMRGFEEAEFLYAPLSAPAPAMPQDQAMDKLAEMKDGGGNADWDVKRLVAERPAKQDAKKDMANKLPATKAEPLALFQEKTRGTNGRKMAKALGVPTEALGGMGGGPGKPPMGRADLAGGGQGFGGLWYFANPNWYDIAKDHPERFKQLEQYRFTVRQYAFEHIAGRSGDRADFTETLYWNPLLIAGADGKAPVCFDLSDSVTTFRLLADAHGAGRIGSGRAEIVSRIPFNLEPKLPLEVNAGDRIDLPLAVVNDSPRDVEVALNFNHGDFVKLNGDAERNLKLAPGQRSREYFALDVIGQKGECDLKFYGTAGELSDKISKKLKIVPPGFPKNASYSGRIDGPQEVAVHLPAEWVPGSLEVTLNAFPTTLASIQKGLDGILQEPNGCFEQASTSNYPNVMTMQYMQENNLANPEVTRRSKELLGSGYKKLTSYECKQKGYEWFGGDPGHEALTAYGLMQFRDMKQVYDVDDTMLERTADWLLARRDGKGGFQRSDKAIDSFGRAPPEVTDAYITWALCESGQKNIETEVAHAASLAEKSDDAYVIALAASSNLDAGKQDEGKKLLQKLVNLQGEDGHLESKLGSITRSGGVSLSVETTALAALAWLKQPAFVVQANKAVEWIVKNRQAGGGFGGTQATILALKALVEHAKSNKKTLTAGKLILMSKGVPMGEKEFTAGQQEAITLGGLEAQLKPGDNSLTISLSGDNKLPYALDISYRTLKPESDEKCPVRLKTNLAKKEVKAGETVALSAEVENTTDQGQPMTIAILGLPAGLEPRNDQLKDLKKAGTIDYYETRSREIVFYWRSLAPKKKIPLKLDLIAAVPGKYTAPASRTYLYYTPEQKHWVEPLMVEISR